MRPAATPVMIWFDSRSEASARAAIARSSAFKRVSASCRAADIIDVSARLSLATRESRDIRTSDTSSASSTTAITAVMPMRA